MNIDRYLTFDDYMNDKKIKEQREKMLDDMPECETVTVKVSDNPEAVDTITELVKSGRLLDRKEKDIIFTKVPAREGYQCVKCYNSAATYVAFSEDKHKCIYAYCQSCYDAL